MFHFRKYATTPAICVWGVSPIFEAGRRQKGEALPPT